MKFNVVERPEREREREGEQSAGEVALVLRVGGEPDAEVRVAPGAARSLGGILRIVADRLDARSPGELRDHPSERIRLIVRLDAATEPSAAEMDRSELEALCHELRTPINALVGYAALLDEGVYGALSGDQAEAVRRIGLAADRLLSALRHLFDRAGIDLGDFHSRRPRPSASRRSVRRPER